MGGGGGTTVEQDPQVGAAAMKNAQTAAEQLQFTKDYFNNVLAPLQQKADQRADVAAAQQTQEYEDNRAREQLQDQRYRQYGIPAEDRYYKMVEDYSSDAEQERQANLAQADVVNAAQTQQQNLQRQFAAAGIDPTSPAAISAATDASVMGAAAQASAANQARAAAKQLGMALISDAANFGHGTTSNIAAFSQMASGNSMNANTVAQQPLANGLGVGGFVQGGYKAANQAYGQNLASLVSDSNARLGVGAQMDAANSAGMGSAIGAGIGAITNIALAAYNNLGTGAAKAPLGGWK